MAIDGGKSRISCQSVSGPRRLKIVRSLVIGKAISCPGSKNSYIATLVERHTPYVILMKIANKDITDGHLRTHQAGKDATQ